MTTRREFLKQAGFAGVGFGLATFSPNLASEFAPELDLKAIAQTPQAASPIKVGLLHSLSGTMAISEKSAVDAEMLAIEEINKAGGVLGRSIEAILEDGASDWVTFREKASTLIDTHKVATVFGCWTSASRKSSLPVFESKNHMLWYPVQYEGQECSRNIFYTGAVPNQQIEPSVNWARQRFPGKPFFLLGSDYVFPRTVNTIVKEQLRRRQVRIVGEDYIPLGDVNVKDMLRRIKIRMPNGGIIYNTLNGDTNVALFIEMRKAGMTPKKYPVLSVSLAEEEIRAIGIEYLQGHYAAWSYFQTVNNTANEKFVRAFKAKYGQDRVINDPMEAAYSSVYLWKLAVEKAGTFDREKVRKAAIGVSFDAPQGRITIGANHHASKYVRIGQVRSDGLFNIVYQSRAPMQPEPWNQLVRDTQGLGCDWSDPKKGGKYRV